MIVAQSRMLQFSRRRPLVGQLFRFGVSTGISAAITLGLPILLHEGFAVDPRDAVSIAFTLAFLVNFIVVRGFVFEKSGRATGDFLRYGATNLAFRLAEMAMFNLIFDRLGLHYAVAIIVVLVISSAVKFLAYRRLFARPAAADVPSSAERRPFADIAAGLFLLLALLLPSLYNGGPILFPDSLGYFQAGEAVLSAVHLPRDQGPGHAVAGAATGGDTRGDGISTARSVFYGLPLVLLYRLGGSWPMVIAQCLLTILVLRAGLRHFGEGDARWRDTMAIALVSLLGGLAVFTSTLMPDLFAGLLIFALAVFLGFYSRLSVRERCAWLALIAVAVLVHKGHVAILGGTALVAAVAARVQRRFQARPYIALVIAAAVGLAGHRAVDLAVELRTGKPPLPTPFLLARVIGDGTAAPYLAATCATRHFMMCRYLDRLPMTENEFLWSRLPGEGVVGHLQEDERRLLAAESREIVLGSIARDPLAQARVTLGNVLRQNVTIGVTRFGVRSGMEPEAAPGMAPALVANRSSAALTGRMPFAAISAVMLALYIAAFAGLAVLVARRPAILFSGGERAVALQVAITGVLVNACVFGAISSTADRYQGRVAWLIPLLLLTLVWRPTTNAPAAR